MGGGLSAYGAAANRRWPVYDILYALLAYRYNPNETTVLRLTVRHD